jgi:GNAT superfamily N-acetyltransferase
VPDWTIRRAVATDLPAVRDVFRRASLSNEGDRAALLAHPEVLEFDGADRLERCTNVAEAGGAVIGFVSVEEDGEVEDMFVDPAWMGRGVARSLVEREVGLARARGLPRLSVTGNPHARTFYERVGFVVAGEVETRFGPGLRMAMDLLPG